MSQQLASGLEREQELGTSSGGPLVFTAAEAFSCAVANSLLFALPLSPTRKSGLFIDGAVSQWN